MVTRESRHRDQATVMQEFLVALMVLPRIAHLKLRELMPINSQPSQRQQEAMRIPTEVLPNLYENDSKTFSEDKGAQPVDSSARLRATLTNSSSRQKQTLEESIQSVKQGQNGHGKPARGGDQRGAQRAGPERRQEERRKVKLPVLLDTRLSRSRRKSTLDSAIDCEI